MNLGKTIMDDLPIHDIELSIVVQGETITTKLPDTTLVNLNDVIALGAKRLHTLAIMSPERRADHQRGEIEE